MTIGQYIDWLRRTHDPPLSLTKLGDLAGGLSKGFLSELTRDKCDPSLTTLIRIAAVFDKGAAELLAEAGYTNGPKQNKQGIVRYTIELEVGPNRDIRATVKNRRSI